MSDMEIALNRITSLVQWNQQLQIEIDLLKEKLERTQKQLRDAEQSRDTYETYYRQSRAGLYRSGMDTRL